MNATRREFLAGSAALGTLTALGGSSNVSTGFIDIRAHAVQWPRCPWRRGGVSPIPTADELLAVYDRLGVERGMIQPVIACEDSIGGESNEEVLRLAAAHPDRFVPMLNIDPRANLNSAFTDFSEALAGYKALGCRGVGEVAANLHLLDPRVQNLFGAVARAELPIFIRLAPNEGLAGLVDDPGLPELTLCLERFPTLKFFVSSSPFWCEIAREHDFESRNGLPQGPITGEGKLFELMRRHPNLMADLSGAAGANALARDRTMAGRFLTEFQDRVFFGLAYDPARHSKPILPQLLTEMRDTGAISSVVFDKVARLNAQRQILK